MRFTRGFFFFSLVIGCMLLPANTRAQDAKSDSTQVKKPEQTAAVVRDSSNAENIIVLDSIEIRGRVQKPGVLLVPKRVAPEMGKIELNRSFDKELKEAGGLPRVEKELRKVDRVESVKKAVEKERK
jgi:hypothetical protein